MSSSEVPKLAVALAKSDKARMKRWRFERCGLGWALLMTPEPTGHPRGIYTLFFTEMWERMSYYGMRALLVLFMVDQVQKGGMGLTDETATAIYGLYTAVVYMAALPGGWIGDRLLGAKSAVWYGGIVIALGHLVLGIHRVETFYVGLLIVALGSGLLKSNMSALVGQLYPEGGARRDAGFTLFYMGINLGGFMGPMICSGLGESIGWRWGFMAAAAGMFLGLVQFKLTRHKIAVHGNRVEHPGQNVRREWLVFGAAMLLMVVFTVLCVVGVIHLDVMWLSKWTASVIVAIASLFFLWAFGFAGLNTEEKKRLGVIVVLFLASALFWAGFEQVGSSFSIFAERFTQRQFLGFEIPAGWFQSLNPLMVIGLAPLIAVMWVKLAKRNLAPSLTVKVSWSLLMLAIGFAVAAWAAKRALSTGPVWPTWLMSVVLIHTLGELFLSPVGLSAVTKLSPPRLTGQMMGIWFLGSALGNILAGLLAGEVTGDATAQMPARFMDVVATAGISGLVLLLLAKPITKLMPGIK
jgi:POT family proton-dependent oligopeptide transporter